jgi:hypothetical protein
VSLPVRCPFAPEVEVEGQTLTLQCTQWSNDPEGRHKGDHTVQTPPAMGDDPTWPNDNPLPE